MFWVLVLSGVDVCAVAKLYTTVCCVLGVSSHVCAADCVALYADVHEAAETTGVCCDSIHNP